MIREKELEKEKYRRGWLGSGGQGNIFKKLLYGAGQSRLKF